MSLSALILTLTFALSSKHNYLPSHHPWAPHLPPNSHIHFTQPYVILPPNAVAYPRSHAHAHPHPHTLSPTLGPYLNMSGSRNASANGIMTLTTCKPCLLERTVPKQKVITPRRRTDLHLGENRPNSLLLGAPRGCPRQLRPQHLALVQT